MSIEVVRYYDGVGKEPSTIVGGSPDITTTFTSNYFIDQLAKAGVHARVVSDEAIPPSRFVPDSEGVAPITFPREAQLNMSGYRPIGRIALEIKPPLDGAQTTLFQHILLEASGPRHDDSRAGHKSKETHPTTAELEQLVESRQTETVAS